MSRQFTSQFWSYLRSHWISVRRVRFWVLVLVSLYTITGFFIVPWVTGKIVTDTIQEDLEHQLSIGHINFNPYTFSLEITDLVLTDHGGHKLVSFEQLLVNFTLASLWERAWTFQEISLDGLVVREERFASGETRLTRLAGKETGESGATAELSAAKDSGIPSVLIHQLSLSSAVLHFVDHLHETASAEFELRDVRASLENARLHESRHFPIQLTAQSAAGGELQFDGSMQLSPAFELDGELHVNALAFAPAEPYLQEFVRVAVESGSASVQGQLSVGGQDLLVYRGGVGIDALSLVPESGDEAVLGWGAVRIEDVDLNLGHRRIEISPVSINAPTGQILIHEDQSTNIGRLLVDRPISEDEDTPAKTENEPAAPFNVSVAEVILSDGDVQFADRSLPLPFSVRIHDLKGTLSTLASDTDEPARVNVEGQVDDYGLARINGTFDAWEPMRETSLELTFRNLEVPHYSPYTVDFVGRRIAAGRMDLDLSYTISGAHLEGRNKILLHDLELGETVEHPDAMDLPLRLAVALLKNSEGVIDMEIPVTGEVGSPEFQLGGAIRKALVDAITYAVSSPFRFLAGLVGADDEDLGRLAFTPGRSDLTPPQRERVKLLREALADRPELVLELPGPYHQELDRPALQRRKALEALAERLREKDRDASSPSLTAEATEDVVRGMFVRLYPEASLKDVRQQFTRSEEEVPEGYPQFDAVAYRNHLAERVIAAQNISTANLAALGKARAAAVQEALLQKGADSQEAAGVEPDRVRLTEPKVVTSEEDEQIVMEVGVATE